MYGTLATTGGSATILGLATGWWVVGMVGLILAGFALYKLGKPHTKDLRP